MNHLEHSKPSPAWFFPCFDERAQRAALSAVRQATAPSAHVSASERDQIGAVIAGLEWLI